jgi:GAF domain-containing protein
MIDVVWGNPEEVPEPLSRRDEVRVHKTTEPEEVVEAAERADCVVSEYEAAGETAVDIFDTVRRESPDTSCILFSDVPPSEIEMETDVVFNYVMGEDVESLTRLVLHSSEEKTQTSYPLADDEDERLREVGRYDFEDTTVSDTFERMTRAAAWGFGVDAAFVSILDEGVQNLVSCYGVEIDSVDREKSVCTYNIVTDGVMVVEDLTEDPRFEDNEVIEELGLEFYAGVPVAPAGSTVGTFCIMDTETRSLSDDGRDALRLFAEEVEDRLRLQTRLGERGTEGVER